MRDLSVRNANSDEKKTSERVKFGCECTGVICERSGVICERSGVICERSDANYRQ